jgi:predicted CXXCH cytochrome family protein
MRATRGGGRRGTRTAVAVALALVAVWGGCAVTTENYDVLSFFFDGVPDPNAPMLPGASAAQIRQSPTYSSHAPFTEDRCAECHERRFNLTPADSDMCLRCHEDVPNEQPLMHGPVAAVACLWCHTAHESPYPALLKRAPRDVCVTCHDAALLSAERVPEHSPEATQSCLECHAGHGGTVRYFLLPHVAPAGGRSEPAPTAERGRTP